MVLRCRELAYQDGFEKAKRYAELAGLKIVKALRISENEPSSDYGGKGGVLGCSMGASTQLPMGTVEKSMTLYIDFIAE